MPSCRGVNDYIPDRNLTVSWKWSGLGVPELYEPCSNSRWGEYRYVTRQKIQRPKREMICMRVSDEDRIEWWQILQRDSRLAYPR
jgi:hypothetical protein